MKILYMISTVGPNSGNGGHYYSLRTTAEWINKRMDCIIVVIGNKESPVINDSKIKVYNIISERIGLIKVIKELMHIVQIEHPDVIHVFDEDSFFFGNLLSIIYKKGYIYTKCGGGNPRIAFPRVDNLILYSQENLSFFKSSRRFKKANIYYIPNRIGDVVQDISKINKIRLILNENSKIFLIISRLNWNKKNAIFQTINLINRLNKEGMKSELIIIGTIQDINVYEELKLNLNQNIHLFTDDEYTVNASELIDIADFVVGSGRSFMEAATRKKIMLCPSKNLKYPILITRDNFQDAFIKNFSDRLTINDLDEDENFKKIVLTLTDSKYAKSLTEFIYEISNEYFEICSQVDRYCEIYLNLKWTPCFNLPEVLVFLYRILLRNHVSKKIKNIKCDI